jgi:magnesium chelatase family protein
VALVGGIPRPGEISLAHHGLLFLDGLPELERKVLEVLREPLESGHITISRAARQADFPAQFQLLSAMNPCPLLDRIDMHIEVPALKEDELTGASTAENNDTIRARVEKAREMQLKRQGKANFALGSRN